VPDIATRASAIERTFAAAFAALEEFAKVSPADADRIAATAIAHVRSSRPQAFRADIDTAPFQRIELAKPDPHPSPAERVQRELADGSTYEAFREEDAIVLKWTDGHGDKAIPVMRPIEWIRFRADVDAVASTVKGGR
jgi:hypothetical protein